MKPSMPSWHWGFARNYLAIANVRPTKCWDGSTSLVTFDSSLAVLSHRSTPLLRMRTRSIFGEFFLFFKSLFSLKSCWSLHRILSSGTSVPAQGPVIAIYALLTLGIRPELFSHNECAAHKTSGRLARREDWCRINHTGHDTITKYR